MNFIGQGTPLSQTGISQAVEMAGLPLAGLELWSLIAVETTGMGYLVDRRPKILFERHYFSKATQGQFDQDYPDISNPIAGGYGQPGAHQYDRLAQALVLDEAAALASASWGLGQVMGVNFSACGYRSVQDFVAAAIGSEDGQLTIMAGFLKSSGCARALGIQDWARVARIYNGPNFAQNQYDQKLAAAFDRFSNNGPPDLDIRAAQVYLTYLGYDTGGIDGVAGGHTAQAIKAFQTKNGLTPDGQVTQALLILLAQS
jgi:hypothetical protein